MMMKDAQVNLVLKKSLLTIMMRLAMLQSPFKMVVVNASRARMLKRLSLTLKVWVMYLNPLKLAAKPNPDMPTKAQLTQVLGLENIFLPFQTNTFYHRFMFLSFGFLIHLCNNLPCQPRRAKEREVENSLTTSFLIPSFFAVMIEIFRRKNRK